MIKELMEILYFDNSYHSKIVYFNIFKFLSVENIFMYTYIFLFLIKTYKKDMK